ncbi:hypothetical protein Syun_012399 [Stephania yunnanensis]|uniref:Uncharacterized protein n=1 Tax=Stephania yunnanensis TaxID=152371 RepID=A0AAP0K048_9MAGN
MQTADDTQNLVKEEPRATSGCKGVGPSSVSGRAGPNQRRGKITKATRRRAVAARGPSSGDWCTQRRPATAAQGASAWRIPASHGVAELEKEEAAAADQEKGEAVRRTAATVVARLAVYRAGVLERGDLRSRTTD